MCISPQSNRSTSPRPVSSSSSVEDSDDDNHHAKDQRKGSPRANTTEDRRNNRRYLVAKHDYHDHASDAPSMGETSSSSRSDTPTPAALMPVVVRGSGSSAVSFPNKLYEMLENVEKDGYENVVSWQPHGRCFVVHQTKYFQQVLLPRYFGGLSKMSSFQRQLNLYGFMRLSRGVDKRGYYHELFLRGKPFLMHRIQRIKVKGTGVRARANPDQEPDFWTMPWVGEANCHHPQAVHQPQSKPALPPISSTASVVSHDCHVEGAAVMLQQQQAYQQPLPPTTRTSPVTRSYSPPNQVLCRHYLPQPLPTSPCSQPQTVVSHPRQQLFLNRVVEPLRHHHSNNNNHQLVLTASSPTPITCSSNGDEEESNSSSDDDNNLVVMTGWGKPFYFLGAVPKAEAATKEKSAPTSVVMPQQQLQQTSPLPPAPRMFISKPREPTPLPLTASVALEFDVLALDFFMDDVLNSNHHE